LSAVVFAMTQERKVFVGGVPQDLNQDDLYATFSAYAGVKKAWLQKCRSTDDNSCPPQNHRGFGFVIFHDPRAIDELLGGSVSRFISLRNGHQVEVKRAMSSVKISQSQEDGQVAKPARETAVGPNMHAGKGVGHTKRAERLQPQWPAHQASPLKAPWMPGADSDSLGQQAALMHFAGRAPTWPWPAHAQPNVSSLMTDALRQQYASSLGVMPQHVPVPPAWPHHDQARDGHAGHLKQPKAGQASRVFQDIMHEYDEHARRVQPPQPMPEKAGAYCMPDLQLMGPTLPRGLFAPGQRRQEVPADVAIRQEVLAAASPARPSTNARPGAPPGLEAQTDLPELWTGQMQPAPAQRYFI